MHRAAEQIVREELDAIGAQEMLMPVINPAEIWQRSGRYDIDELFKLKDRRGADLVLAMTHEEVVTTHVAPVVRSYRDLPFSLYHFQTKGRDEPRPRAGVLRTREFIMKDAYTFDRDREGLDAHYERYREAYDRIFDRVGLEWYRVESDVGMMGGVGAHEYMAPCPAGENDVALAPGYAANVEVASAQARPVALPDGSDAPERVDTPGLTTVAEVAQNQHVEPGTLLKAYPVIVEDRGLRHGRRPRRPPRQRHQARERARRRLPPRARGRVRRADRAGRLHRPGRHRRADPARRRRRARRLHHRRQPRERAPQERRARPRLPVQARRRPPRRGRATPSNGHEIRIEPAIEVGNIFKLGTRFSEPLGATYLDESGTARPIWMGSYGIGPARIAAAAIEQHADEHGISWPRALAPFDIHLVGLGKAGSEERELAERLYGELLETGLRILYDDRDAGPGEKFADAELLGVPVRLTVGRRTLESGEVEVQVRRGRQAHTIPLEGAAAAAADLWRTVP